MTKREVLTAAVIGVALSFAIPPAPGFGQGIPVIDTSSLAQLLEQVTNQLEQIAVLEQQLGTAVALYEQFSSITSVGDLARLLNDPELRGLLPEEFDRIGDLMGEGLDQYGSLASRVDQISNANSATDLSEALRGAGEDVSEAERYYLEQLDRSREIAARDMALGEQIMTVATTRLEGLEELRLDADGAGTVGELQAIAARVNTETAMMTNDILRLQGLAMVQEAEARLVDQQVREREAAAIGAMGAWGRQQLLDQGLSPLIPDAE